MRELFHASKLGSPTMVCKIGKTGNAMEQLPSNH